MTSLFSFITLAFAGMVVASPLKRGTAGSLSGRQDNPQYENIADCHNETQIPFVVDAHAEAVALANGALVYIADNGVTDELFITYFGSTQDPSQQLDVFSDASDDYEPYLHCTDPTYVCGSVAHSSDFGAWGADFEIVFCPSFYNQVPTGYLCTQRTVDQGGIRGATTLFVIIEQTDEIGDHLTTEDCSDARNLASTDPETARDNAANYICFAMQVFVNSQCN